MRHTFKAYERLKREQHIDTLFRNGKAFSVFPIRLIYHFAPRGEEIAPARVGFSVPKKKFRKAVQRNRVRRLMREGWRLNKHTLYAAVPATLQLHIFLVFTDAAIPDIGTVTSSISAGIEKLVNNLNAAHA